MSAKENLHQGAAAVGYDGGTSLVIAQKRSPQHATTSEGFCAVTISAVAKALGAILAPTLTPCTRCLYVQHLGPFTTSPPVAARLGIVGVGH